MTIATIRGPAPSNDAYFTSSNKNASVLRIILVHFKRFCV